MNRRPEDHLEKLILANTGASGLRSVVPIQELWSGYGEIVRVELIGAGVSSVVAKWIKAPGKGKHPRGWDSDFAHLRKIRSYEVETEWYRNWARSCVGECRVPRALAIESSAEGLLLVLEDLDGAGFPLRKKSVDRSDVNSCLRWLAGFHALFLGAGPDGLWETGTYWHLATRPDEWEAIADPDIKEAASAIDETLSRARFQTIVHGDAKLANFCFPSKKGDVAMVDFQYVGRGCGIRDVAYFLGSCLSEEECERQEESLLAFYFASLEEALQRHHPGIEADALIEEWTDLYPVAWTDFHRFLMGWCPRHWKINRYSERLARETLARLQTAS